MYLKVSVKPTQAGDGTGPCGSRAMLRLSGAAPRRLIALADRARAAGQWKLAAGYYRNALGRDPGRPAIWVQYGHALKETGHLAEAEVAYRRAIAGDPEVADFHLQLGHVLKLQGRIEEAKAAYRQALLMADRLSSAPLQELVNLGCSESELARLSRRPFTRSAPTPEAIANADPAEVFARKDLIMRELFDGIVKATRPDIICDIGSFNCDESVRLSKISPQSRVYAFEANHENIRDFIKPRSDLVNVKVENLAVSDFDGEIPFHILEVDHPHSEWRRAAGSLNDRTDNIPSSIFTVQSVRLDTYFNREIEAKATFVLWIDVEGALDRVFTGATKILAQTILLRAEVERHEFWVGQRMADEVIAMAQAKGFVLLADSWTPEVGAQSDVLMINRQWLHLAANPANNVQTTV